MSRLKPIGSTSTSIPSPIRPAIEYSTGTLPGGGLGKLSSAHRIDRGERDDRAGALQEYTSPLPQAEADVAQPRPLVLGHLHQETRDRALGHRAAQHEAATNAPTMPVT